ncbi:hydantoinase/oxoprolinase family protein [Paraburkholderia phytofirmans]|uniref:5-oxoprolinase (ATP-hydrolyzing) n=1 Tax=Paraburkholderia phytofirmans (strain DSM 17436 / LMG 22146 / PsJN) TaxID=398527 RepID=B2TB97_PARPJ|nr:hydantoinase/oxoprolinase family protein [Paraburkholderia phytofirmans]ACD20839.1 5-oxoprolinase (ATP-hydrolyzing) [Paraburkholderia phytofirmans PsJN]
MLRIGVDVGGSFTDFVLVDTQKAEFRFFKVSSTPHDPSVAIAEGVKEMLRRFEADPADVGFFGHGTTVATNMIIERRGVATGLLTTKGFRDVLDIGRQTRPALFDYSVTKPPVLVERHRRVEVEERLTATGDVETQLNRDQMVSAVKQLRDTGVESVAICFLHSYRNPKHEQLAKEVVQELMPDAYVSISSDVLPEFREYERTSTTVLNAYVGPPMKNYLARLEGRVREVGIPVEPLTVHSNGGLLSLKSVEELPVLTCLSGPAAGVVGAAAVGSASGFSDIVTFDVGGTSTDVSLIEKGRPKFTPNRIVAGYPVKVPMIDIHVIGAGGGSIANVDDARGLKVGPRSAGAAPGPVAYGKGGTEPTLTDANIYLRRLNPVALLEGRMPIDREKAGQAIRERIAEPLGISVEEAAYGMLQIASANMSRAIRAISTEHGHDLAQFSLMAFGGAGPLFASEVARECGLARVLVPIEPGTMCARGALVSNVSRDFVRTQLAVANQTAWEKVKETAEELKASGENWLTAEKITEDCRRYALAVDARYVGQNYDIAIDLEDVGTNGLSDFVHAFGEAHMAQYGYAINDRPVEIVNVRLKAIGLVPNAALTAPVSGGSFSSALIDCRSVYFGPKDGWLDTNVYRRSALPVGESVIGPVIIEEMSSTTVVLPGQKAQLDNVGNIIVD